MRKSALENIIDRFVYDRIEEMTDNVSPLNRQYQNTYDSFYLTFNRLRDLVKNSEDVYSLILELESLTNKMAVNYAEMAYREGIRDGHTIQKDFIAALVGQSECKIAEKTQ